VKDAIAWQTAWTSIFVGLLMFFLGIFVGEPLKRWVNGNFRNEKEHKEKQADRQSILNFLDGRESLINTSSIRDQLFPKKSIEQIYEMLNELKEQGRVDPVRTFDNHDTKSTMCMIKY